MKRLLLFALLLIGLGAAAQEPRELKGMNYELTADSVSYQQTRWYKVASNPFIIEVDSCIVVNYFHLWDQSTVKMNISIHLHHTAQAYNRWQTPLFTDLLSVTFNDSIAKANGKGLKITLQEMIKSRLAAYFNVQESKLKQITNY